jgi:hypothetical protein
VAWTTTRVRQARTGTTATTSRRAEIILASTALGTAVDSARRYLVLEPPVIVKGTNYWVQANALYHEEHEEDE